MAPQHISLDQEEAVTDPSGEGGIPESREGRRASADDLRWVRNWALAFSVCALLIGGYLFAVVPAARIAILVALAVLAPVAVYAYVRLARPEAAERGSVYVFATALVGMGLVFAVFFTPFSVPDEDYHYAHAYKYANLMAPGVEVDSARREDIRFISDLYDKDLTCENWESVGDTFSVFARADGMMPLTSIEGFWHKGLDVGGDPFQARIASAVGINLARLLNLSGVMTFYVGRVFNMLLGAALIILAVRLTPIGRNAMMAIALFPMTLHLLGSYSYDATTLGLAFLLIALTMRLLYGSGIVSRGDLAAYLVVATLIGPCKIVYFLVALPVLLVPSKRFASRRTEVLFKAAALLLPVVAIMATRLFKILSILMGPASPFAAMANLDTPDPLASMPRYSMAHLLTHPLELIKILVRTTWTSADFYLIGLVGGSLGWLRPNIAANIREIVMLCLLAVLAFVGDAQARVYPRRRDRVVFAAVFVLIYAIVSVTLLLDHTPQGSPVIEGVQGRYFLPALPLVYLALSSRNIRLRRDLSLPIVIAFTSFNCIYLARIAFTVLGG